LITELNDDKFAVRQLASQQLAEMGAAVVPDLVQAAQGKHLEVTSRALDVLKKFLEANNPESQVAARQALQELAATDHPAASSGARKILADQQPAENTPFGQLFPNGRVPLPAGRIVQRQAQIQLQIQGGFGGGNQQKNILQVRQAGGRRTIEASDNEREIKIVEDQQNGIQMEVTAGAGDQRKTKKYTAKNAAELKKKHPQAHKLYEKYSKNNGLIFRPANQGLRVQIGPAAIPQPQPRPAEKDADKRATNQRPPQPHHEAQDEAAEELERIQQQLQKLTDEIDQLQNETPSPPDDTD
jgi:hypothetical protein